MSHAKPILLTALLTGGALACDQTTTSPSERPESTPFESRLETEALATSHAPGGAMHHRQLAALRRATAPFHNFGKAQAAGYVALLTPCLEQLPDGAQGFHYGNPALIDGSVNLLEPEILQYEPQPGGHLRLVGVEYIVPLSEPEPAPLLGQHFHANPNAGIWGLHVWLWRHNPSGMFADWNPKVSCEHAS
ncbi:MAG: hypothetical protein R3266_06300 [Gemmatimonadota bacterium]|nr:hypothetical protein [Gemmatimonadota bacterium]